MMLVLIMVAVLKGRKSKSSQYRYLAAHRQELLGWLELDRFPSRTTYFDRYRRCWRLLETAVGIEGRRVVRYGLVDAHCVAVDQSVVPARGPRWNKPAVECHAARTWKRRGSIRLTMAGCWATVTKSS